MSKVYDVAVIGVGGMGSAACFRMAQAGLSVLGIEQFSIPNTRGSSHGATRILRLGLHESEKYVPMVMRAVELWRDAEQQSGEKLFHAVGSIDVAEPHSRIFWGSRDACETCDISHEVLDADEIRRRFPAIHPTDSMMAVYQHDSGFVLPELAICTHVNLALAAGAEIHGHKKTLSWEKRGDVFRIETDRGHYEAAQLVVTAGAWLGKLFGQEKVPVTAERCVLGWFAPLRNAARLSKGQLPVWIIDSEQTGHFYGFPIHGMPGFKLGRLKEIPSDAVDPDLERKYPDRIDELEMREFLAQCYPDANGSLLSMETCFFENTADRSPILDQVPGEPGCWVLGGFSGHGYKYASAVGEIACDLVLNNKPKVDLTPFRINRFISK